MLLPDDFYTNDNVVEIAKALLGKVLFTQINNEICSGIIVETEAYAGINDKASHAYGGKRTTRTEIMYRKGGCAYIYLIYGMYSLFNVVTNIEGIPHAVLVRSIFPYQGIDIMEKRLGVNILKKNVGIGPGRLSKLMGFDYKMSGTTLSKSEISDAIWIENQSIVISDKEIKSGKRIGVSYAGEDAELHYRFWIEPEINYFFKKDY